jgi:hypothetical protein
MSIKGIAHDIPLSKIKEELMVRLGDVVEVDDILWRLSIEWDDCRFYQATSKCLLNAVIIMK